MKTIAEMWQSFADEVIPLDAPPIQFDEMRKAFYAGAFTLINMFKEMGEPDVPEDRAIAQMEALSQECDRFVASLDVSRN